ncbi:MAG: NADAR family protein [Firmicutes bacterium]|nr:NADAR family protein [Bacillota bacterium]
MNITEQKYTLKKLKSEYIAGKKFNYVFFWGHHPSPNGVITKSCFSQWFKSSFEYEGRTYCCMEQFMMAHKAILFKDEKTLDEIMKTFDPAQIKSLGRKVKNFDEKLWDEYKFSIVYTGNLAKFSQNPDLKSFLLGTKDKVLAEASPYDGIWGIKMSADDENAEKPVKWRGTNLLGFALMQVRDELSKEM